MRLLTLPTLRELAAAPDWLTARQKGSLIRLYLEASIRSMDGGFEFQGEPLDAVKLCRVLRLLLKFEGSGQDATNRRERVLHILGLNYPLGQLRRPDSPERELLRLLAVHMVSCQKAIT
jgi:hypothetical protein